MSTGVYEKMLTLRLFLSASDLCDPAPSTNTSTTYKYTSF